MAVLTSKQRAHMPQSEYALSGKRFPINDAPHAEAAIRLAPRALHAGNISKVAEALIKSKAEKKLGE